MDDHFSRMLAPVGPVSSSTSLVRFLPSEKFAGRKPGYYFAHGSKGNGYYYDPIQNSDVDEEHTSKKRKIEEPTPSLNSVSSTVDKDSNQVEESDQQELLPMDSSSLRQFVLNLDKKINKNQLMRAKYPNDPEKFMDSEIEVFGALEDLYPLAVSPDLYPEFLALSGLRYVLGMITHENTDISIAAVGLLQEMTEREENEEENDDENISHYLSLIRALHEQQGFELVIQNLSRLHTSSEDDSKGIFQSFSVLESALDLIPSLAKTWVETTSLLSFLASLLVQPTFDTNKLYASELLSILLQSGKESTIQFVEELPQQLSMSTATATSSESNKTDGMELLLRIVSSFRKKDPESSDEKELLNNVGLCLCTILASSSRHQLRFLSLEGFELLIRCIKDRLFVTIAGLKICQFAVSRHWLTASKWVEVGGLKYLFPIIMGKWWPHALDKKKDNHPERLEFLESGLNILCQLCLLLGNNTAFTQNANADHGLRLQSKLYEKDGEKMIRLIHLWKQYQEKVDVFDQDVARMQREYQRNQDPSLSEFMDPEVVHAKRLEGGLDALMDISVIIIYGLIHNKKLLIDLRSHLTALSLSWESILEVLHVFLEENQATEENIEAEEQFVLDHAKYIKCLVSLHDEFIDALENCN